MPHSTTQVPTYIDGLYHRNAIKKKRMNLSDMNLDDLFNNYIDLCVNVPYKIMNLNDQQTHHI